MAPNSNRRLTLFDIARAIDDLPTLPDDLRGPLRAEATFTGRIPAYPTGAAVCEAEVDPETGTIEIRRYTSIDDGGQPINPLILHGQVHGGVAQGMPECFVAKASEMQDGDRRIVVAGSAEIGVFYKDGDYFAYSNYCVHSGGPACAPLRLAPAATRLESVPTSGRCDRRQDR